ncbi:glycosyltransferase [Nocardia sp. CT2-14]|uniref:Glycosyltransferase n=1 Tax=Nocardia aurantiaca TaxID=2675850 RepID=A0A6I3L1L3_9NOCA|nr:glycosyltransferase [Nocardia aurantiaca]
MNVLVWHVHGSWTTSFVQGPHTYLLPADDDLGEWARGRDGRPWPENAVDIAPADLADTPVDIVVLQRPRELDLVREWLGRTAGLDLPAVYVEHGTPDGLAATTRHPLADHADIPLVHVTQFNRLMWDCGRCPTTVIPQGVVDPGYRYTGELPRTATVVNDPVRCWRALGADLLAPLSYSTVIDVYGRGTENLSRSLGLSPDRVQGMGFHDQNTLHSELARRRVYLHTPRWTSLGFSVIEAMFLGMPIVAVGATAAAEAIPSSIGVVSSDPDLLAVAIRRFLSDPDFAELTGWSARHWAQATFGIRTFQRRWNQLLFDCVTGHFTASSAGTKIG